MERSVVSSLRSKLNRLLNSLLEDECKTAVFERLINFIALLREQDGRGIEAASIAAPALIAWLQLMVSNWRTKQKTPSSNMVSFALKTSAWLATNEQRFNTLNTNKLVIKLTKISARESSTKRDYIALLSSMLEHKTGVELIIRCGFWERVLESSTSVEEASMFLSKFLEETVRRDLALSDKVVTKILVPLCDNLQGLVTEDVARLKYTLELINSILHYFLDGILMGTHDFQVVLIFLKHFHLEERASDYLHLTKISSVHFTKIMYVVQFLNWYMQSSNKSLDETTIDSCCVSMENNFLVNISEGTFEDILNLCEFGMLLWKLVEVKIITQQKNKPRLSFTNPVLFTLLWPQYSIMNKYFKELHLIVQEDPQLWHLRDQYENKLKGIVSLDIVRLFYFWRGTLLAHPNIFEISIAGLNVLKTTRKYFTNFQAGLVFQTLVYILQDVVGCSQLFPEKLELMQIETKYYAMVFEFISLLIGEFQITWTDSLETIDVLVLCFDHLSMVGWSPATVVQTLKLLNVAINKYMDPNLALLVDSTNDSTVASLGPLLYCKLNNDDVEVQKGALDVVNTMARISIVQFPSLQKVLMDSELPTLVVKMSTCDGESFVRATAIKCLQEMIQVEDIWSNVLKSENLAERITNILVNETEGIVRVEAATFMCVAYEHQRFPQNTIDKIYETMIYASTVDLHWEVKVRALDFWDKVIKKHLQNQGMIDGSFPNVTFSKEHRKIMTLTDSEIRRRLLKVLGQLSAVGCLGVLVAAIKDDCDIEVSKTAAKITQFLVDLFKEYNVKSDSSAPTSPFPTENGGTSVATSTSSGISVDESMADSPAFSQHDLHDEVIDQIVNSNDAALLKNVYAPSDYGSVNNYDIQVRKIVTPNQFLEFTQQDLASIINEKKNWLNGIEDLGSLLDDILKTYEDDVNNMDCY